MSMLKTGSDLMIQYYYLSLMSEDVRRQMADARFCRLLWSWLDWGCEDGCLLSFGDTMFFPAQHLMVLHWIKYSIGFTSEQVREVTTARCKIQLFYLD